VAEVGQSLSSALLATLEALPEEQHGPQALAKALGLDKVLASRVLKAVRMRDPIAVAFHMPGPDPLRRLLRAAGKRGAPADVVAKASAAVDRFERLIQVEAGDRGSLDAMICAWLPEARRDFELRRKQAVFKAMSQLKGMMAHMTLATVLIHPSSDGLTLDIVWGMGLLGFQRLRPNVRAKIVTRRMALEEDPRLPRNLDGDPILDMDDARLDEFCDGPPAEVTAVSQANETIHYYLAGSDFGPDSGVDLVLVEVNEREMQRYVPRDSDRKGHVFAEVSAPTKALLFDVLVHEDVYPGREPQLMIYDTVLEGVADINDRSRDGDRLEMAESIQSLGKGAGVARDARAPKYVDMLRHVFERMGWDDQEFRVYRCSIAYPLYGSQVAVAFEAPPPPAS
jgi:hypothetical protein